VLLVRSDNSAADFLRFFSIFFVVSCVWGMALWLGFRVEPDRRTVIAAAVLFRVLLLPAGISLETGEYQRQLFYDDDVWRYLWEGHAWSAGVNPMRTPPSELEEYGLEQRDPELFSRLYNARVWSDVYDNIGYREVASPYPYAAQAVFRLAGWLAPGSVLGFKLIIVAFDLAAIWLLAGLAGSGARGSLVLLAYAWNPLVIKEFAASAHIDAVLVCLLLASLTAARNARGGMWLGLAALVKPVALLFTPAMVRRAGWKALLGPAAATGLLLSSRPQGMAAYAQTWTFNPALFRLLPGGRWTALAAAAVLLCALAVYWMRKDDGSREALYRQGVWLLGGFLLLTPMFAPWYLTWLLPLAALQLSWFWLALSGSIFISYHAYLDFADIPALAVVEFAIPFLVWVWLSRRDATHMPQGEPPDRKAVLALSSVVGLVGGLCCVTPVLLVLAGVLSVSSAAALGNVLYGDYRWAFRFFGVAVLAAALVRYFRAKGVCTLDHAKRRRNWIINVSLLALAASSTAYVFWTYVVVHYWGIAAGLPWAQYDESWAIPVAGVLAATTMLLFVVLRRSRGEE
jgi:hypothetical protein